MSTDASNDIEKYDPEEIAARVYHLRKIGVDWKQIQRDFVDQDYGVENVPTVDALRAMVRSYTLKAAQTMGSDERQMVLGMEMARLDDLQAGLWPAAIKGDVASVDKVLKVMAHRAKLLGLDQLTGTDKQTLASVLIVGGDTQSFIEALEHGRGLTGVASTDDDDDEGPGEEY